MAEEQEVSPSPRSISPFTKVTPPSESARESQTRIFSPLRIQHKADGSSETAVPNGELARPVTASSVKFGVNNTEPKEFPFHAPNGTLGPSPMTEMVNGSRRDHGGSQPLRASDSADFASGGISRKNTNEAGASTPGRRSVQFARSATFDASNPSHSRNQSWNTNEETEAREKQGSSLMSKLKALAAPISLQGHGRSLSNFTIGDLSFSEPVPPPLGSSTSDRFEHRFPGADDSEADADAESASEGPSRPARQRRKSRRFIPDGPQTAPTTPRTTKVPPFPRDSPGESYAMPRPAFLSRRATMTDIPEHQRQGVSEDEGRNRLAKDSAWRRGMHSARGLSYSAFRRQDSGELSEERRPSNLRRFTGIGGGSNAVDQSPSAWRLRAERTSSISAQKWRQLRAGIKMLATRKKEDNRVDLVKSAELMAELIAGAPAALFLASMFQRDEHGHKRVPVLLEQLKIQITDSHRQETKSGDRHVVFRIELEYGSGITRMKWVIYRSLRDFANLHLKYKFQDKTEKYIQLKSDDSSRAKLPRFPKSAFPYLRGMRGLFDDDDEDEDEAEADRRGTAIATDIEASGTERAGRLRPRRSSFGFSRRKSSTGNAQQLGGAVEGAMRAGSIVGGVGGAPTTIRKDMYMERQRKKLETYLQQMITYLIFRPDSNRLCKFLELSALGVRLAGDGGYHGKEGFMIIRSVKGIDFKKKWQPHIFAKRHSPKWFLVRQSYIVCVDSIEEMHVFDVFLVDPEFTIDTKKKRLRDQSAQDIASKAKTTATHPKHHQLRVVNSERTVKLLAKNERQLHQFEESIRFMLKQTEWAVPHRFESFAPVRQKVFAQWLVDGRDYMWCVARAISMARDVIYIHDWWLSPELYLRRPPAISQKWRLDRLLQRKANEGVKIFVIMYRNINSAIPIDSEYSKFSLLDLHPNVFVQRSPNQFRSNTFFWAHHEKICIVDHMIAFCGGIDLCFGRWDTAEHVVVDDKLTGFELNDMPKDNDHCQMWPGKDYSNPRVQDFYALDKPYEEMYDRTKVPRMPWHDIGMQIVGQPARDLTRHFVQRWNFILRQRTPSRPTPMLLPPPDFNPGELEALGLEGTCEIQILRSAAAWSTGTPDTTEHSIMNAYVKLIQTSEHFVYIENQFFVSSCEVEGTKIENKIGDALVDRIKRAHRNQEHWRCVIIIPLMPGFQNTVDSQDGSSVRLIMTCQYRSICRGPTSIFGRLRDADIEPEDYIEFYALRSWGKIGPNKALVTEQLYIHAKCMIVDDRAAIIGSANINERSMLGSRDSEVAAIVRDTAMVDSFMAGRPFKVGRFPHDLRMRLMREHLGLDVDTLDEEIRSEQSEADFHSDTDEPSSPIADPETEQKIIDSRHRVQDDLIAKAEELHSFNHDVDWEQKDNPNIISGKKVTSDPRVTGNVKHEEDVEGRGADHMVELEEHGVDMHARDTIFDSHGHEVLVSNAAPEGKGTPTTPKKTRKNRERSNTVRTGTSAASFPDGNAKLPPPRIPRMDTATLGLPHLSQLPALPPLDDTDIGGPPLERTFSKGSSRLIHSFVADMRRPIVTPDCMRDPVQDGFYLDTWHTIAENNTKLFRSVFRCMPDNEVKSWKEYKEYAAFQERFNQAQGAGKSKTRLQQEMPGKSGPPGSAVVEKVATAMADAGKRTEQVGEKLGLVGTANSNKSSSRGHTPPGGKVEQWAADQEKRERAMTGGTDATEHMDEKAVMKAEDDKASSPVIPFPTASPHLDTTSAASTDATVTSTTKPVHRARTVTYSDQPTTTRDRSGTSSGIGLAHPVTTGSLHHRRRRRGTTKSSTRAFHAHDDVLLDREDAERLLEMVQGHLVVWPYDWLEKEERDGGWLYTVDQIAPLEIYS